MSAAIYRTYDVEIANAILQAIMVGIPDPNLPSLATLISPKVYETGRIMARLTPDRNLEDWVDGLILEYGDRASDLKGSEECPITIGHQWHVVYNFELFYFRQQLDDDTSPSGTVPTQLGITGSNGTPNPTPDGIMIKLLGLIEMLFMDFYHTLPNLVRDGLDVRHCYVVGATPAAQPWDEIFYKPEHGISVGSVKFKVETASGLTSTD